MPRPTGLTYMSRAEGQKKLNSLPKVTCSCGHTDVQAAAYYSKPNSPRNATGQWAMCVPCFRNREKLRQQGKLPPLTIEDIRSPKRPSGFDHVRYNTPTRPSAASHGGGKPYQATGGGRKIVNGIRKGTAAWTGPLRATAEEAAQDYCDYINSQRQPHLLTIEDIRNPKCKSGYRYVQKGGSPGGSTRGRTKWFASVRNGHGTAAKFIGPRRDTPEEAAQDYCDYINSQRTASPATTALKSAGHQGQRDRIERTPEVEAALGVLRDARGARQGKQGYVYLIGEAEGSLDGDFVKIGFSTKPDARPAELQTGNPRPLVLLAAMPGTMSDEALAHQKFIEFNTLQEWFEADDSIYLEFGLDPAAVAAGRPMKEDSSTT